MLVSKWKVARRRYEDRLVLEIPAQVSGKLLAILGFWLALWPVGALALPIYLTSWIESAPLRVTAMGLVAIVWMVPWFRYASFFPYWLRGLERITIRPGSVEIERGVGRRFERRVYDDVAAASWRVSPRRHHVYDWHGVISADARGPGPRCPGGALTFVHGGEAVRCGRNFGTRTARALLGEIQLFLGHAPVCPSGRGPAARGTAAGPG